MEGRRIQSEKLKVDQLTQAGRAIHHLQAENERLSLINRDLSPSEKSISLEVEQLQTELRLTMKEVALLRNALIESDHKLLSLQQTPAEPAAPES